MNHPVNSCLNCGFRCIKCGHQQSCPAVQTQTRHENPSLITMTWIPMNVIKIRWWQLKYVLFSPLFGEDEPILTIFFQMGWFNHQLEDLERCSAIFISVMGPHLRYVLPVTYVTVSKKRFAIVPWSTFIMAQGQGELRRS